VKWEPKPVWSELKILTTDPRCKERINHALSEVAATRYVRVKRAKGET
jgi:TusA-related sulfurtransferase